MRSVAVVVLGEFTEYRPEVRSLITITWSRHSVRMVLTKRSAIAFAFGDLTGVLTPTIPSRLSRESGLPPYTASRSWIRWVGWRPHGVASSSWRQILGHMSSVAQSVLERMDAMISEMTPEGLPVAYNRVAGVVVTGNEDGAPAVIADVAQGLIDIGYTVPGQAWTYWNMGPGPGPTYTETDHKHEWSKTTGETCAQNLVSTAMALGKNPLQKPAE